MRVESSSLLEKFELESGAVEIKEVTVAKGISSLVTKALGLVASVAVLSLVFMAGKHQTPVVGYPQGVDKIVESHLSEEVASQICDYAPGASALVNAMNLFRKNSNLASLSFYTIDEVNSAGVPNPLTRAARNRNQAWGDPTKKLRPASPGWVSPNSLDTSLGKQKDYYLQETIGSNFKFPSYVEYDYYGENCITKLFQVMKGDKPATSAGSGIKTDLMSSKYTDVAVSIWTNSGDLASKPESPGTLNAYFVIFFSTSTGWISSKK